MFLWFAVMAFVLVAMVFESPALDYRLVMVGAVLPVFEALVGGPWILHTLIGAALLLAAVMLIGRGRRLVQRRWLGLPIGVFMHLVLDGTWTDQSLFWWPLLGTDALGDGPIPEVDRWGLSLALELVAIGVAAWAYRAFDLSDPDRRRLFVTTGRLGRLDR